MSKPLRRFTDRNYERRARDKQVGDGWASMESAPKSTAAQSGETSMAAHKPKVVCLCGSSRFVAEMACIGWGLERDEGYIVLGLHLLPANYPGVTPDHMAETEGKKEHFDNLHKRKIDLADEVLVVNIGGYIGESTCSEIAYAVAYGKPVRYIEDSPYPPEQPAVPTKEER